VREELPGNKNSSAWAWLLVIVIIVIGAIVQSYFNVNHDVYWLLEVVQRKFLGGKYYYQFFESNPPLILYLYMLPVWLAQKTSSSVITFYYVYLFLLAFLSLLVASRFFDYIFNDKKQQGIFLVLWAIVLFILPSYDFGQRSHIALICLLPYVCLLEVRRLGYSIGWKLPLFIGFFAFLGLALKPYYLIPLFLAETWLIYCSRKFFAWFRLELLVLGFFCFAYLVIIALLDPEYYTLMIPFLMRYYSFFFLPLLGNDGVFSVITLTVIFSIFIVILFYRNLKVSKFLMLHLLIMIGFYSSYIFQKVPWYYHFYPVIALSMIISVWIIMQLYLDHSCSVGRGVFYLLSAFVISAYTATVLFGTYLVYTHGNILSSVNEDPGFNKMALITKQFAYNKKIYVFNTQLKSTYVLEQKTNVENVSRFPHFWMIPGMILLGQQALSVTANKQLQHDQDTIRQAVVDDFIRLKPSLVLIDVSACKLYIRNCTQFDYLSFLFKNKDFRSIWKHYHYLRTEWSYAIFQRRR
jgi:hypothetical protein